jgi:hypothetical protein
MFVPRSKHLQANTDEAKQAARDGLTFVKTAAAPADPKIAPIFMMLRWVRFSVTLKMLCSSMTALSQEHQSCLAVAVDLP